MCMLLLSPMLYAQTVRIFVKFIPTSGSIPGESVVVDYTDYIEIYGFEYNSGVDHSLNNPNAKPVSGTFSFQKPKSKSSSNFYHLNTTGLTLKEIEIKIVKQSGLNNGLEHFMTYKFGLGFVKSISDGPNLSEEIDIVVGGVWTEYKPTLSNGTLGSAISYGWDFVKNISWNGTTVIH